ncbi:MAG: putative ABC transporter permease [Oscillospiraceae bacterium]|nr:putative ABC transporter permease [Oscillospiraceae bacterium]
MLTFTYALAPERFAELINSFFLYSFLGWIMECIVITYEKKRLTNRGFVHGPFCIIYGFGSMIGYVALKPFAQNAIILYCVSALAATCFEFLTAKLMIALLGDFWWDYSSKPFNYKGILCLESTLAWGVVGLLLFYFLHDFVEGVVRLVPAGIASRAAVVLVVYYIIDFCWSFYIARREKANGNTAYEH